MNNVPHELVKLILGLKKLGINSEYRLSSGGPDSGADGTIELIGHDRRWRFGFQHKRRAPYLGELAQLRLAPTDRSTPLLLAPRIGPTLRDALVERGWSWADGSGNFDLRAPGLRLHHVVNEGAPPDTPRKLPGGPATSRAIRWLIASPERIGVSALARIIGISQAGVSKIVKQLRRLDFVSGTRGLGEVDRAGLLYAFAAQYAGPGGQVEYGYTLEPPVECAKQLEARYPGAIAVSADVGPDRLAPWRVPTTLLVYARAPIDPSELGIVPAQGSEDANVLIHYPEDPGVFALESRPGYDPTLADPVQMYIDLERLGGEDRREAQAKLEAWLLS